MTFIVVLVCAAILNFILGTLVGYGISQEKTRIQAHMDEKEIYCHGFEDGIYYVLDEYRPELYRPEIAEMCYKEYKAVKHGPEKH
jgi:hypothetical protein